ncbi:MAG TPA: 3-phosphoserine/phosphohydroxythreonine transaminase [Pyrinomonadaceae bacterium]|nr:3-phosphoserine/phosphohydroxythreonine transaminase [Pyrinomonadaceae bacterium]
MRTVFNFYSGPATLPPTVLERAQAGLANFAETGMSVMEVSHRSREFVELLTSAEVRLRSLLQIPDDFRVFFLQGGASLQFSMVPMNFLNGGVADYVLTGVWGEKAAKAASAFGTVKQISFKTDQGYRRAPDNGELRFSPAAVYVHYVSNETIDGVEFGHDVEAGTLPVICDASSDLLSRQIDLDKYAMIYAGAQKNLGPSGVTVVVMRNDLLERANGPLPLLNYRSYLTSDAMPNTPNTWGIYVMNLVLEWLLNEGGTEVIEERNIRKAALLYDAIDGSDGFYSGTAEVASRSRMNVVFRLSSAELEDRFCREAEAEGLIGLRGHRSAGGIRASIYNAFPIEGVERLIEFMDDFAGRDHR